MLDFNGMSTHLEVMESHSLYVHIYILCINFFKTFDPVE